MNKSRFTEQQIIHAMRRLEVGETPKQLVSELGISEPTLYNCKKKYLGMGVPELCKLTAQDDEISRFKRLVADLMLDKQILQDVLSKKL